MSLKVLSLQLQNNLSPIIQLIKSGHIGVLPTDTIYGIVASALDQTAVDKLYNLRRRTPTKPFIILISSIDDLSKFDVQLTNKQREFLSKNWPNPLSVILNVPSSKWHYLHRGTNSLAFRLPDNSNLIELLSQTGPLVAPSANLEGEVPANTIHDAKKYFGDKIAFYVDGGQLKGEASTLVDLQTDTPIILRQGDYQIT